MAFRYIGPAVVLALALSVASVGPAFSQDETRSGPSPSSPAATELVMCRPSQLSERELRVLADAWIDALWSFYRSGDQTSLVALATPQGIERLRAHDWRFRPVELEQVRFKETAEAIELNDWQEWCTDGRQLVALDLEPIVDITPGARTWDADLDRPIEAVQGAQRRVFALRLTRASEADPWLVDDVGASTFRARYRQPGPRRSCPGLKDAARVGDPFLMEPWCDANGDGRKILRSEVLVGRPFCWAGAHQIGIGLPPGAPRGFHNTRFYIRDPQGVVPDLKGFRRDARLPKDAISSGITNGYATIWTSKKLGDDQLIVQVGNRFERWPASNAACSAN